MIIEKYVRDYLELFRKLDRKVWNYEDGCVIIGCQAMYEATGKAEYYNTIKHFLDRYIGADGSITYYDLHEYNIDRIPSGRPLFLLYKKTGDEKYKKAIDLLMSQIKTHPRTPSGNLWHKQIYPNQIWLDGLYMGMPFYALYEKEFDGAKKYDDIVQQFVTTRKFLFDEKTQLYYHACDESKTAFWADKSTGLSANFWSRAMGWYVMALADCCEIFGDSKSAGFKKLAALLVEAIAGILKYQDAESKLFYQLTALPDVAGNYLETSSSLMIACAVLKGCRLGILDKKLLAKGEEILLAVENRMFVMKNDMLSLTNMCVGAGLGPENNRKRDGSVAYYLSERIVPDEQKGVGALLMAYGEWLKNDNGAFEVLSKPAVHIFDKGYV